jgi:catechol 2,3-dioxygenase-like lactoylglutathione lyase family enzyme
MLGRGRGRALELERGEQRAAAWDDARQLVLQLTGRVAFRSLDHYQFGLALDPREQPYRSGWCYWQLRHEYAYPLTIDGHTSSVHWPAPTLVSCLLTSEQVAFRDPDGILTQIYWSGLLGVSVDLGADQLKLDYSDGRAGLFSGPTVAQLAVVAIARIYGPAALLEHPSIAPLRRSAAAR